MRLRELTHLIGDSELGDYHHNEVSERSSEEPAGSQKRFDRWRRLLIRELEARN